MKKIKNIIAIALIVTTNLIKAQQPTFNWVGGIGSIHTSTNAQVSSVRDIAVDAAGNTYIVGEFDNSFCDFDPSINTVIDSVNGGEFTDCFILKLNPTGGFVWVKTFGTTSGESMYAISLDPTGNIYLAGELTTTMDMDPGAGVFTLTPNNFGNTDNYILKLDNNGGFLWAKQFKKTTSIGNQKIIDIKSNASGVYVAGELDNCTVDIDPGVSTYTINSATGTKCSYYSRLDPTGNFLWGSSLIQNSRCGQLTIDGSGNIYACGSFFGTVDLDLGSGVSTFSSQVSSIDHYMIKADPSGNLLLGKTFGNAAFAFNSAYSIDVDAAGSIYIAGLFTGTPDFDPGVATTTLTSANSNPAWPDIYINKLDLNGNFVWVKSLVCNSNQNIISNLNLDATSNIYLSGSIQGTIDFDPSPGTTTFTSTIVDGFISKLDGNGNLSWAKTYGGSGTDRVNAICIDNMNNIYACGNYSGSVNFNPPSTSNILSGSNMGFVLKLNNSSPTANLYPLIEASYNLNVYPNPSNGILQLTSDIVISKISVTDALGKEMQLSVPHNLKEKNIELNLKHLSNGIYFITVFGNEGVQTQKIIIEK